MLAKWWWRFHNEGNALWCKLIRSIHGQSGDSNTTLLLKSKSGTWYDKESDNIEPLDIPAGPGTWKVYKRKKFKKGQMKR
ncbi:hypothetical protein Tco_1206415 [Tanacetum coccineum]